MGVLDFLVYNMIKFKTDLAASTLTLNDSIAREWNGELVSERSPEKESQSNVSVETPTNRYRAW